MYTGIYKIINKVDRKYYVGSSKDITESRWVDHKKELNRGKHYNKYLQNAWNKYGESNFDFVIIEILPPNTIKKTLLEHEQKWLNIAKSEQNNCYNLIFSAGGGGDFSEEVLNKMKMPKLSMRGKYHPFYGKHHSEETKLKISNSNKKHFSIKENTPMFEKHHSEKTKLKISKSRTGKYFAKNNPNFGKKHTEESKLKISNGHKGKILSEEHKNKLRKIMKDRIYEHGAMRLGSTCSEKTKEKISMSLSGKLTGTNNPMFGKIHTDESKQKMSMKRKGIPMDTTIYTLKNVNTGEIISNTKLFFFEKHNLHRSALCKLLRSEIDQYKGWIVKMC